MPKWSSYLFGSHFLISEEFATCVYFIFIYFRKIFFEGRTVSSGSASHFEKLDINVKNRSPTQINFFCRRIEQQYQDNENFTPKVC